MIIGQFRLENDRYIGIIQTLIFSTDAVFVPVERAEEGTPDYVITAGETDLGMAWRETTPEGQSYLLVKLDDPLLPHPIFCRLIPTGPRGHTLLWDRVEGP